MFCSALRLAPGYDAPVLLREGVVRFSLCACNLVTDGRHALVRRSSFLTGFLAEYVFKVRHLWTSGRGRGASLPKLYQMPAVVFFSGLRDDTRRKPYATGASGKRSIRQGEAGGRSSGVHTVAIGSV